MLIYSFIINYFLIFYMSTVPSGETKYVWCSTKVITTNITFVQPEIATQRTTKLKFQGTVQ